MTNKPILSAARRRWILSLLALMTFATPVLADSKANPVKLHYGFEMQGDLIGYMEVNRGIPDEKGEVSIESLFFAKMTLLAQGFDIDVKERLKIDSATGRITAFESDMKMGTMNMGATFEWEGGKAFFTSKLQGGRREIELPEHVEYVHGVFYSFLVRDLKKEEDFGARTYPVLELTEGKVREMEFTLLDRDPKKLPVGMLPSAHFRFVSRSQGLTGEVWIDPESGHFLEITLPTGGRLFLADPAVVGNIKRAEIDDSLFARVDLVIPDFKDLTYLEVRAEIESAGEWITEESLNVKGQRFTGTVKDNLVKGVFEIEHKRYSGAGAPPFPPDFSGREDLKEYLEPEQLIESDDPVLGEAARKIAKGAVDSWDAAIRLSRWVAEEIPYEIPGGSARTTYDARKGECGSHSRLLCAFCRSLGIPARLASGCMYTPLYGGSFGQHVWNEIYMGDEAGWITVDSTAMEVDYVDSGHVRLGSKAGFHPKSMEIIDCRTAAADPDRMKPGLPGCDLPYPEGEEIVFRYVYDGKPIGTDTFSYSHEGERTARQDLPVHAEAELSRPRGE